MPLRHMMTATATTARATMSSGKKGNTTTHLENVKITPPILPSATGQRAIREMLGLEGAVGQLWETYSESHEHTDNSVTVTQVPDIIAEDRLTVNGTTYYVHWAESNSATFSFGETLVIYMTEDKRA